MFDIIICAYNNLELTKKCVESVRKNSTPGLYRVCVVDDGSTDGTGEWCVDQMKIHDGFVYWNNSKNKGYVYSAIEGVDFALEYLYPQAEYIFMLNNDVVLKEPWMIDALALLETNDIIGAYGMKELKGRKLNFISGSRLIVKTKVIKDIGFYDPKFKFGYWEDVDFSTRAQAAGYKIAKFDYMANHTDHIRNSTFKHNPKRKEYYEANKRYLESKL